MKLTSLFSRLKKNHILVVGDFMMDSYTIGSVQRVSPEAPVLVMNASKVTQLPGGAGNVVLNLLSLGAKVSVLGRLGDDVAQQELRSFLEKEGAMLKCLYTQKGYKTPIKNRVIAGNQQIVRVDFECATPLSDLLEEKIIASLPKILKEVSVVAISDYAKGFLTQNLLKALIEESRAQGIPVIVDPKGNNFEKYSGAHIIKPNLQEAYLASSQDPKASLDEVAKELLLKTKIENIIVTRSSEGISLFNQDKREDFSVKVKEVVDVTGAGDTVLAVLTFAVSHGLPLSQAIYLCNLAAAEVIEHLGCARISIKRLAELILEQDLSHKVFSNQHLSILQFILDHEAFILVEAKHSQFFSSDFFKELKELKLENEDVKMVVYLENNGENNSSVEFLASLSEVDFIIESRHDLELFCKQHTPKQIFELSNNKLKSKTSLVSLSAG